MDRATLRKKLLENAKAMCAYAENELKDCATSFRCEYERGFVYGYSDYNISFSYSAKKAKISINWYHNDSYYFMNGNAYDGHPNSKEDVTKSFLTNMCWGDGHHMEEALTITQNNWSMIKQKIAQHKMKEEKIMNFTI